MKKTVVLVILLVMIFIPVFGQDITVTYVDGDMTVQENNSWYDVFSGDVLEGNSTVKVGPGSVAEFEIAGSKIILNKPGTYKMAELVSASRKAASFGNPVNLKKFITGPDRGVTKTAVMGVRGAQADSGSSVEWLTEDNMALSDAKDLIGSGKYEKAIDILNDSIDDAFDEELPEYDFYIGKSYYLLGEPGKALSYLSKVAGDPSADYYPDLVVLKGNLFLDSFAYNDALILFDRYLKQDNTSETAQLVAFLSAKAYSALGKKDEARNKLKMAVSLGVSNEVGKTATSILASF